MNLNAIFIQIIMEQLRVKVYFDEAGNTGQDLLNVDQPVFVLAANNFDDETACSLVSCLHSSQSQEAKFKNLKKTQAGQNKIIKFFEQDLINEQSIFTFVFHKKFMALTKIFDLLVETVFHYKGINFYANNHNVAICNMNWCCIPTFYGEEIFINLLDKFICMIRNKDDLTKQQDFYSFVSSLSTSDKAKSNKLHFEEMVESQQYWDEISSAIDNVTLDPAFSALFAHSVHWGNIINGSFEIIHDESNTISSLITEFNTFMNQDAIPTKIGSDHRSFDLPLKAHAITLNDSKLVPQIQIADIVASSTAYFAKNILNDAPDDFTLRLKDVGIEKFMMNAVWPDMRVNPSDFGIKNLVPWNSKDHLDDFIKFIIQQKSPL